MLLKKKVERAMRWSRERRMRADGRDPEQEALEAELKNKGKAQDLPSMEELRAEELEALQNESIDSKSVMAMIVSAFLTIFPVCVAAIVVICLVAYFFFFH